MMKLSPITLLLLFVPTSAAFLAPSVLQTKGCSSAITRMADSNDFFCSSRSSEISRKDALRNLMGIAGALAFAPSVARADVSDGNQLPQGAQQFARVLRLKTDLQGVKKRVTESADELDSKEWDNIGKFLRGVYAASDDMKSVAAGIYNPDNKKRALEDISQMKKYAQAADIAVSKKDAKNFLPVLDKVIGLVDDFFDSLSDVPDEL